MRVLVLVMCSDNAEHAKLPPTIRATWGRDDRDDFRILYHYGYRNGGPPVTPGATAQDGDTIVCGVSDLWEYCLPKRILALDHARRHYSFDLLYSVCCGSYVDRDALLAWVADKPREKFYAGVNGPYRDSTWRYASGSGFFVSPDLVNLLADNRDEVMSLHPHLHHFDDVCIGHFLADRGVIVADAPRIDDDVRTEPGNFHWHYRVAVEKFYRLRQLLEGTQ